MKTKRLKTSVVTIVVIFLFAGASWADGAKNRHHGQVRKNHIRTTHDRSHGYQKPSDFNHRRYARFYQKHYDRHRAAHKAERRAFKHHQKYHRAERHAFKHHQKYHRAERHAFKHRHKYNRSVHGRDHYRHKVICKHYHKHKPSYNVFSYGTSVFEPGWSISIKTKSRW